MAQHTSRVSRALEPPAPNFSAHARGLMSVADDFVAALGLGGWV